MFDQQYQSPKQEPFIKQEFDIDDISQYQYPPADWFPQTINTGLEPGSFPSTMSHQFSSRSYSSNSTQDSIGYFDQTTEQWTDFDSKDEYVNSPTRDNSFPSPMPLYYGEPTYLDNDSLQTPRRTDAKALSAIQGSTRTDNATMQVSSSYQQSPLFDQSSSIHLQSSVPMTRQTSNTPGKVEVWQCLKCQSHFTRCADLNRHYTTVHNPAADKYDCPKHRCGRIGENGFTRKDHLKEHLRQYHKDTTVGKRGRK